MFSWIQKHLEFHLHVDKPTKERSVNRHWKIIPVPTLHGKLPQTGKHELPKKNRIFQEFRSTTLYPKN